MWRPVASHLTCGPAAPRCLTSPEQAPPHRPGFGVQQAEGTSQGLQACLDFKSRSNSNGKHLVKHPKVT